ncbi:MAG: DNA-3-methyladenine glycosylase I [Thermomicrobiales bacterium]
MTDGDGHHDRNRRKTEMRLVRRGRPLRALPRRRMGCSHSRRPNVLFRLLMLEGFQAGLSWITILRKRDNFDRAFDGWDPERLAAYGPDDIARLMDDAGIIRNRLKIEGAVKNTHAYLRTVAEEGSFSDYLWSFVGGEPLVMRPSRGEQDFRATSPESDAMSRALKKRGFTFVGSTICYAFMQSAGLVDDHLVGCWRSSDNPDFVDTCQSLPLRPIRDRYPRVPARIDML